MAGPELYIEMSEEEALEACGARSGRRISEELVQTDDTSVLLLSGRLGQETCGTGWLKTPGRLIWDCSATARLGEFRLSGTVIHVWLRTPEGGPYRYLGLAEPIQSIHQNELVTCHMLLRPPIALPVWEAAGLPACWVPRGGKRIAVRTATELDALVQSQHLTLVRYDGTSVSLMFSDDGRARLQWASEALSMEELASLNEDPGGAFQCTCSCCGDGFALPGRFGIPRALWRQALVDFLEQGVQTRALQWEPDTMFGPLSLLGPGDRQMLSAMLTEHSLAKAGNRPD